MVTIQNNQLKVTINTKGAELQSIYSSEFEQEYMWSADPQYWAKKSPVLFPIVGTLKNNTYYFKDKAYQLSRHGFARDMEFSVSHQADDTVSFLLTSNDDTLTLYPFKFEFTITYIVNNNTLTVEYKVANKNDDDMYFSVGGHPAFKVPLTNDTDYNDYELKFNKKENAGRWPISNDGLIEAEPEPLLEQTDCLPLTKELFKKDALVLKHLQSNAVRLESDKTERGLQFTFTNFPYLGLWAAPGADFVCIEPWCGIADSVNADQQLTNKEGIIQLAAGGIYKVSWQVTVF